MTSNDRQEQDTFENEVRRIARQLWPDAQYAGARLVDGRERDGYFETEECIHLIEATVSRAKDKAQYDIKKLVTLAKKLQPQNQHKAIKGWFVTKSEPTAEQREVARQHHTLINALSFSQFQSKLIDAASYLSLRDNYPFGSVRDPATGDPRAEIEYVPLELLDQNTSKLWSAGQIRESLTEGGRFVILGDFGAGKSMTLRELYKDLKRSYLTNKTTKFPLYLNLRDHHGQTNPAEVVERHARNLGFPNPTHLVRAWRAGYVVLLIDGFDELATLGIQGIWKRLQDTRFRAMQAVRELIRDQPSGAGLILAGRAHFFDSERERRSALGLTSRFAEVTLNEFSDEQIRRYLTKCGLTGGVPGWVPSRPLLVGYLAASGLLKEMFPSQGSPESLQGPNPAQGWNLVIDKICTREAEIEAGIDGPTIRRILERLATTARATDAGLGPLGRDQIVEAFASICGYQPDEKGMVLLQRLPGLGIDRADEGTRIFIDGDFADACRAGDVVAFIDDPYGADIESFRNAEFSLGTIGVGVCIENTKERVTSGKLMAATIHASGGISNTVLTLDLVQIALERSVNFDSGILVRDVLIPSLELHQKIGNCSQLTFRDCYFSRLELDPDAPNNWLPHFDSCYFVQIDGRASRADLPERAFADTCEFEKFSDAPETTDAISAMDLPLGEKVLLTVLKKVFIQSGSGRKENALLRGLDHNSRRLVPDILRLLQSDGVISPYRRGGLDMTIWVPDRGQMTRVAKIIESPRTCSDSLLKKAGQIA
ncbi:MAG: NACHT domain-containing protein [Candidatus Contendobacter sp.]